MKLSRPVLVYSTDEETCTTLGTLLGREGLTWQALTSVGALSLQLSVSSTELILFDLTSSEPKVSVVLLELLRRHSSCGFLAILPEEDASMAEEVTRAGAYDFITKPLDSAKVATRLKVSLARHDRHRKDWLYQRALEGRLHLRTEEAHQRREQIRTQFVNSIHALERALQAKHVYTEGHSHRVAEKAMQLAREFGIQGEELRNIELAALFHDIGKIGIRDEVLNKESGLTDEEYEHIKQHPVIGEEILSAIEEFRPILPLVRHEHEHWDGSGYPDGLRGQQIPFGSRLIAIADAWDAIVIDRTYRPGRPLEQCVEEMRKCSGTQFDPACVEAFIRLESRKDKTVSNVPVTN